METLSPEFLTKASFPKAIELCQKQEGKYKTQEVKKAKYAQMRKKLEKAQEKLDNAIEETRSIKIGDTTFFDSFIKGKEDAVSLTWLGTKLEEQKAGITDGKAPDVGTPDVDVVHIDFVDRTKQVWHDLTHGKGIAKGLFTAAAGICVGEVLTQGVTASLVRDGIMQSSMGLVGLGQLGLQNLPLAWNAISGAITGLFAWSPVAVVAAGALAALKVIPAIRGLVDKVKAKAKSATEFETGIQKLVQEQKGMEATK